MFSESSYEILPVIGKTHLGDVHARECLKERRQFSRPLMPLVLHMGKAFECKDYAEYLVIANILPLRGFVQYLWTNCQCAIPDTTVMCTEIPNIYERVEPGSHNDLIDPKVFADYSLSVVLLQASKQLGNLTE